MGEYRPDQDSAAALGVQEIFQSKLVGGHFLSDTETDLEVLYKERVAYLANHPEAISLLELSKAASPKQKVEVTTGDEFCRLMAALDQRPVVLVDKPTEV